jgi:HEAT repeat protein
LGLAVAVMPIKRLLCPQRLRRIPRQFSWIDQRLVREHYIERLSCEALALYLLLVTVADVQGLSYYSDRSVCRLLALSGQALDEARSTLMRAGLIAYQAPLYQVLALEYNSIAASASPPARSSSKPQPISTALARWQRSTSHRSDGR